MNTAGDPFLMQTGEMPSTITTTLYDLMAAMQAVVGRDEDALVVATMVHVLRSGRITFVGEDTEPLSGIGARQQEHGTNAISREVEQPWRF